MKIPNEILATTLKHLNLKKSNYYRSLGMDPSNSDQFLRGIANRAENCVKSRRRYICAGCKGQVSIPKGRRLPLSTVQATHEATCPGKLR